jgi:hypothetical protein
VVRRPLAAAPLLALAGLLLAAPRAGAGGDPLQLAACGSRLWVVGQGTAAELDAVSGRTLHRIRPRLDYPVAVACSGDEGLVGSVVNGYGSGAVQRVSAVGRSTPLPGTGPVYDLAAWGRRAWVLTDALARRVHELPEHGPSRPVPGTAGAGWVTAGADGLWIVTVHSQLRLVPYDGPVRTVASDVRWPPAPCAGGALVPAGGRLVLFRPDGRRVWSTSGPAGSAACSARSAYTLSSDRLGHATLFEISLADGRTLARRQVPAPATDLAAGPAGVWVAISGPQDRLLLLARGSLRLLRTVRLA